MRLIIRVFEGAALNFSIFFKSRIREQSQLLNISFETPPAEAVFPLTKPQHSRHVKTAPSSGFKQSSPKKTLSRPAISFNREEPQSGCGLVISHFVL